MTKKSKIILVRRKTREVITVKQTETFTFVCPTCHSVHTLDFKRTDVTKKLLNGEKTQNDSDEL